MSSERIPHSVQVASDERMRKEIRKSVRLNRIGIAGALSGAAIMIGGIVYAVTSDTDIEERVGYAAGVIGVTGAAAGVGIAEAAVSRAALLDGAMQIKKQLQKR